MEQYSSIILLYFLFFIGYINNSVINIEIYFNLHMRIDEQILNIIHK